MKKNKKNKIAIIGMGRFGRLLADLLSSYGDVFVLSRKKIDDIKYKQIEYKELGDMDIVIPAVPISEFENTLKIINNYLQPGSLVMDVCSVKTIPCQQMKKIIKKEVELLGTHPMFGPDSAKAGLEKLQVVVCPVRISKKRLKEIVGIFEDLKLKVIEVTPAEHDKQAAKSLMFVHFLGRGLSRIGLKTQEITTLGFERLLAVNETVNNDTWQLFLDMQNYNPYTGKIRKKFIKVLEILDNEINESKGRKA